LEKIKPYWERLKKVWDDIVAWWEQCWLKRLLDAVDEAGGWWNWIVNIFKSLFNRIKNYLASTKLAKWIGRMADWWKNFSFKNMFKTLWTKIKNFFLNAWNNVCDAAANFKILYPNSIDAELCWKEIPYCPDIPYPSITVGWASWRPFSFMAGAKAEIKD
jgi:hypothetical protein